MSKKSKDRAYRTFKFHEDIAKYIKEEAERLGVTQSELISGVFSGPFALVEFEETTGKVSMKWWKPEGAVGETPTDPEKIYDLYRKLRDGFEPVSAGIDYHKSFMIGGGFVTQIKDPLDKHQQKMKILIDEFNATVYQDYYTKGMDNINDLTVDEALTVGCSAAEIVYKNDEDFDFFKLKGRKDLVTERRLVDPTDPENKNMYYVTRDLEPQDWKKLGGIARLKFIDNAIMDLVPFRDPNSLDIRYWILQKKTKQPLIGNKIMKPPKGQKQPEPLYLHPWQVFLVSWNRRGTNVKGVSIIKPVLETAALMKIVKDSMGKGYKRWSDKKYFFVCVPDGTSVWTPEGYKPIESIKVGDDVWSRHSTAEVLQTFKSPYKGDLINIKPKMLEAVSFTPNHPIKVAQKRRLRTKEGHEKYLTEFNILNGYKRADELTTDDWLIVPKIKENYDDIWINFPYSPYERSKGFDRNRDSLPSQYLSEDLAKLFGWYLAEGCPSSRNNGVIFSLGKTETHYAKEIVDLLLETLGLRGEIKEKPIGLQVIVNSKSLSNFMIQQLGKGANDKHLPDTFLFWPPEILSAMISRIVMGDGHLGKDNWFKLKLNSKTLQKQLQLALLKLGHRASLFKVERNPIGYIQGRMINQHNAWMLTWNENNKSIAEDEENYYFRVMETTRRPFEGYVYNFHSSSNEMLLPFRSKQCGSEKRPWGRVTTRNFLKAMEIMIKKNLTGIPVPTGFDVKEIGGEVLDARNFLDFLKSMIAAGMHFPLDFLEQGRTAAGDKAWLAWQVTYGRSQQQLRRAIEHQLWQKHLWGIEGVRHRERKQGVPVGKGKWIPTFVPKLQWRSESKWHQETRLKMDTQILNVASPVGPQLKLATEKDIAKIMGWGDVVFPTYAELERTLKKEERTEKLEEENERLKAEVEKIKLEYLLSHPKLIQELTLPEEDEEEKIKTKEGKEKEEGIIEEKERQTEERVKGGVSRTSRDKETKKGVAKLKPRK